MSVLPACPSVTMCVPGTQRSEEGVSSPDTGVVSLCLCWESNLGPIENRHVS